MNPQLSPERNAEYAEIASMQIKSKEMFEATSDVVDYLAAKLTGSVIPEYINQDEINPVISKLTGVDVSELGTVGMEGFVGATADTLKAVMRWIADAFKALWRFITGFFRSSAAKEKSYSTAKKELLKAPIDDDAFRASRMESVPQTFMEDRIHGIQTSVSDIVKMIDILKKTGKLDIGDVPESFLNVGKSTERRGRKESYVWAVNLHETGGLLLETTVPNLNKSFRTKEIRIATAGAYGWDNASVTDLLTKMQNLSSACGDLQDTSKGLDKDMTNNVFSDKIDKDNIDDVKKYMCNVKFIIEVIRIHVEYIEFLQYCADTVVDAAKCFQKY